MPADSQRYPRLLTTYADSLSRQWVDELDSIIQAFPEHGLSQDISDVFRRYGLAPGKFVRPSLFLSGYFQGRPGDHAIAFRLAVSLEFLHLYLLIQDDIMDESLFRRGHPSLHVQLQDYHRSRGLAGDSARFGRNIALLLSDVCANQAESIWSSAVAQGSVDAATRLIFDQLKSVVYWGQYRDIVLPAGKELATTPDIIKLMEAKTASYSLYYPLLIGLMLGGVPASELGWLQPFANDLGVAFQIVDDILGVFGDPRITGKPNDSDIEERKQTVILCLAYERADTKQRRMIEGYYKGNKNLITIDDIREVFVLTKVEAAARDMAAQYCRQALVSLERSNLTNDYRDQLRELAGFVLERQT